MISSRNKKTLLWSLTCSVALLALWALLPADSSNAAAQGPAGAGGKVLATVAGQAVSQAEVDARIVKKLIERQPNLVDTALEELIDEKLVALEAAAQKTTAEQLLAREVTAKAAAPTDAEVESFYEQQKARIPPNVSKEQVIPQIRSYLLQQKADEAKRTFYASLRTKYAVNNMLQAERSAMEAEQAKAVRPRLESGNVPAKGPAGAAVTIVEFSDFQCPFCARVTPTVDQALSRYGDKVRVLFRQFPLDIHPMAPKAAEASLCAHEQGKFWEMHDAMFANQKDLAVDALKAKAAALHLDTAAFNSCLDSGKTAAAVKADFDLGVSIGVNATPAIYVNGRALSGAVGFDVLGRVIDEELKRVGAAG